MKNKIYAGELMYQLAKEQDLLEPIKKLCEEARKSGSEKWTNSGLIRELGRQIKAKDSKGK